MPQRDVQQFERVVLPHLDDAYTLARYLLRDEHDAQDAVQDAVLRALRYFESYRDGDARAWLLAIVRNCCLSWHRRQRIQRASVSLGRGEGKGEGDADLRDVSAVGETDARAIARSERAAIERALAALPVEFREVVVLREVQELSYKEISDVVGVPIGTVMSRLARARKRLANALGVGAQEVG